MAVTVGADGRAVPARPEDPAHSTGPSTGTKLAIGAGAAALFGCYQLGCFSGSQAGSGGAGQQRR